MTDVTATSVPGIEVRRISIPDLKTSFERGWADFRARPTTAIFLIVVYPFIGLLMYRFAFDQDLFPLLFPMASGFALVGPIAATALYEMSKRREMGTDVDGVQALSVLGRAKFLPILLVGLTLLGLYVVWIISAQAIWSATMGDYRPTTLSGFLTEIATLHGLALVVVGCSVGALFALVALAIGAISLPAIVDRGLGAGEAISLSVRALVANPRVMLAWGIVVGAAIVIGSIPALLGLMVVLPIFGHATWHLYRAVVAH